VADYKSPGVYVSETDYSNVTRAVGTSTAGFVGVFEKGEIGKAIELTSLADAERKLGAYLDGYFGLFAIKSFFENGGTSCYAVRTVHYVAGVPQATSATAAVGDRAGVPVSTLQVDAASPGTWGNALSAEIAASTVYPTTGFNLYVKLNGVIVERWNDLLLGTANVASDDHLEKRINGKSAYVKVTDLNSVTASPNNRPAVGTVELDSATDGLTGLTSADFLGSASASTGLYALDSVDVNFVAIPGEADATSAATLANGLLAYCEGRQDCVAIIEAPAGSSVSSLVDFRKGTGAYSHTAFNSSFGALYGPWLNATHPVTGRSVVLPPSGFVAGIYARSDVQGGGPWAAPAGLNRGGLRGALSPELRFSQGDMGTLYDAGVNPLGVVTNTLVVNGQRTLQLKASATDRVNVRRLLAFVEKSVQDALNFLVFEPNYKRTWESAKRSVGPFLTDVRNKGGMVDYLMVCDETINTPEVIAAHQLRMRVFVKPTLTAEFIPVDFAIAPPGADFAAL
jgi:phage tail sheath protein FI